MEWLNTPVPGAFVTARFGESGEHWENNHTGTDYAKVWGSVVQAVADGTVTHSDWGGNAYGNLVKIDHGSGLETWYAHLSSISNSVGEKISAGESIGRLGATGNVTGPHVHFEVRENGTAVAPEKYLGRDVEGTGNASGGMAPQGGFLDSDSLREWAYRVGLFAGGAALVVFAILQLIGRV